MTMPLYIGKTAYGLTTADSGILSMLSSEYDSFEELYNMCQKRRILISPERAGVVKLASEKGANIKEYSKRGDFQRGKFKNKSFNVGAFVSEVIALRQAGIPVEIFDDLESYEMAEKDKTILQPSVFARLSSQDIEAITKKYGKIIIYPIPITLHSDKYSYICIVNEDGIIKDKSRYDASGTTETIHDKVGVGGRDADNSDAARQGSANGGRGEGMPSENDGGAESEKERSDNSSSGSGRVWFSSEETLPLKKGMIYSKPTNSRNNTIRNNK